MLIMHSVSLCTLKYHWADALKNDLVLTSRSLSLLLSSHTYYSIEQIAKSTRFLPCNLVHVCCIGFMALLTNILPYIYDFVFLVYLLFRGPFCIPKGGRLCYMMLWIAVDLFYAASIDANLIQYMEGRWLSWNIITF